MNRIDIDRVAELAWLGLSNRIAAAILEAEAQPVRRSA